MNKILFIITILVIMVLAAVDIIDSKSYEPPQFTVAEMEAICVEEGLF